MINAKIFIDDDIEILKQIIDEESSPSKIDKLIFYKNAGNKSEQKLSTFVEEVNNWSEVWQRINYKIVKGKSLKKIMKTEQPQLINHHAAHVDVRRSQKNPIFDANQNIIGLLSMLQATENTSLKKIIFASSGGAIYGEQPIPTHERSLTTPTSPYGVSKRAGELYIQSYSRYFNIPYVSLRYGNVYGVRQNHKTNSGIIGMIIESQIQNKSISIYGDGSQTRDYIHVEDVVRANIQASNTVFNGEVNIGTGIQTSITKLIDIISKIMHQKPNVLYLPKKKEEQHDCKLSTALAYKKINWKANISIYEGIKKTIKKYDL